MRIAIDVKTNKKAFHPGKEDLILYDGKQWYVTTKADVFKEYEQKMDAKIKEFEALVKEVNDYRAELSEQMIQMSETVKKFVELQQKGDK